MTTATTGTGTITLGVALPSYLSFASAGVLDQDVVTYVIEDGANREIGVGTYTSAGATLSRDTVLNSTNGGAKISLSGNALVYIDASADDIQSSYRMLGASAAASSVTGTLTETALATVTVPASSLGANGRIRIFALFSFTNSANSKIMRIRFGGIAGDIFLTNTQTTNATLFCTKEFANRNATNSQVAFAQGQPGFAATTAAVTTGTQDTTVSKDVVISGLLANTGETITLESYTVEMLRQA